MKTVLFVNFSNQPFSAIPYKWKIMRDKELVEEEVVDEHCKWDNVPDTFAVGESRYMEDWRAEHYAKHLINRELDKLGKALNDATLRTKMMKQCVMEQGKEIPKSTVDMELMNQNAAKESKKELSSEISKEDSMVDRKKPGRPVSEAKKVKETEPEFPDLKTNGQ